MPVESPVERLIALATANVTGDLNPEQQAEFLDLKEKMELGYAMLESHARAAERARQERRKIGALATGQVSMRKSTSERND